MPAGLAPPPGTSLEAQKSAASEVVATRHGLTPEEAQALVAVGVSTGEHRHIERPWGHDDRAMVRRLTRLRGWSPAAIATFLNRPEARVRASLNAHVPTHVQQHP